MNKQKLAIKITYQLYEFFTFFAPISSILTVELELPILIIEVDAFAFCMATIDGGGLSLNTPQT